MLKTVSFILVIVHSTFPSSEKYKLRSPSFSAVNRLVRCTCRLIVETLCAAVAVFVACGSSFGHILGGLGVSALQLPRRCHFAQFLVAFQSDIVFLLRSLICQFAVTPLCVCFF